MNLEAGELVISKGLIESRTREIFEKDTKTHQARRIALDAGTVPALRGWGEECERRAALCGGLDTVAAVPLLTAARRRSP